MIMHLTKLSITNFGVYRGENSFDLATNGGSIILFGGKNGAGKTTLLNAMRLCLYGSKALGSKVTKKEYAKYINQYFHRNKSADIPINSASVELEFEFTQSDTIDVFTINRSWNGGNKKEEIDDQLLIKQSNSLLQGIEDVHWQSFIEDLLPPGIFDLFFFDGEKISSLMIDGLSSETLAVEIKRLLGLDLIEKLEADLDIYLYQQRKENVDSEEIRKLDALEQERGQIDQKTKNKKQERAQISSYVNLVLGEIDDLETKINRESSGYAIDRKKWQERLVQTEIEKDQTKKQIHDLSANLLPFALVPKLTLQLKEQLLMEALRQSWQSSQDSLAPRILSIRGSLQKNEFWEDLDSVEGGDQILITEKFSAMLDLLTEFPEEIRDVDIRHQLSATEKNKILSWIDTSQEDIPEQLEKLDNVYKALEAERRKVALDLRKIPSDKILQPLVDKLNILYKKLGNLEGQQAQIDKELNAYETELSEAQRRFAKAYLALRSEEKLELQLELVTKTQRVLEKFSRKQTRRKLQSLEELLVARFRELSRKENFIVGAQISEKDLSITLFDSAKNVIPKEQLSAGEQQMFAIAMMWALRQLSGRPYPVVIDTPLGRLDSDHRERLVNQYFPNVSHQVILFSTDTEVDQIYFEELKSHISHSYHLDYDSNLGATSVSKGYFWNEGIIDAP